MEVLKLVLVKMFTYEWQFFLLTHDLLQDSRIMYRLPNSRSYFFFLRVTKLNKCTMKPFSQSLFFREAFCTVRTPSSPLFRHENATEKYHFGCNTGIIYLSVCFSFIVSWCSEMQFGVIYLEAWRRRQPCVAFWTLEFLCCCFVCSAHALHLVLFPSRR